MERQQDQTTLTLVKQAEHQPTSIKVTVAVLANKTHMLTIFKLNNKVKGPHNEVSFLLVVKELTYFKYVTIIVTKQLSLIAVINIFSIIVTVVVTIKINHKTTKNVKL